MTTRYDLRLRVLWLGIEGESGLWEIRWDLASEGQSATLGELRTIVAELSTNGWIQLTSGVEPGGVTSPIAAEEVPRILGNDKSWEEPEPRGVSIRYVTTDLGERVYWESAGTRDVGDPDSAGS
jgi:hypothetical protein